MKLQIEAARDGFMASLTIRFRTPIASKQTPTSCACHLGLALSVDCEPSTSLDHTQKPAAPSLLAESMEMTSSFRSPAGD